MGKRSMERMTGLSQEERIQRAIKRKQKEEEEQRKAELELAKALLDIEPALPKLPKKPADMWEIPSPMRPIMRQLTQLEKERARKKES